MALDSKEWQKSLKDSSWPSREKMRGVSDDHGHGIPGRKWHLVDLPARVVSLLVFLGSFTILPRPSRIQPLLLIRMSSWTKTLMPALVSVTHTMCM